MNRADARASFLSTPPANAFRTGVYEVVSQNWWTSTLGHVEQKESARTLRNRLQRDELAVGRAWLQQCEQSVQPAPCLPVFGETILGAAVYKAIVDHGRNEADTMRELGEVYGALLQSVAMTNHIVEASAGFAFFNGEPVSTYQKYVLLHVEAIFSILDHSRHFHMFEPADLARKFRSGVMITLPERDWDSLDLAASYGIRQRVEGDRARVAAAVQPEAAKPQDIFTALLGTAVCNVFPVNSEGNVRMLGEVYGALLKSIAFPGCVIHAPGGFSYHAGQPTSTSHELAHRQPTAAQASVFYPLSRRQSGQRW
ncbi:hypothetical protein NBRC10512v2_006643 [Rhodotorula toruloides]